MLESLFNSEYCKHFKNTYFEEHLQTAASENVFIKLRKKNYLFIRSFNFTLKNRFFQHQYKKSESVFTSCLVSHEVCIHIQYFFGVVGNKLQTPNTY